MSNATINTVTQTEPQQTNWVNNEILATAINLQGVCNTATGSLTSSAAQTGDSVPRVEVSAGDRLGLVFSAVAAVDSYEGVVTLVLQTKDGHGFDEVAT